MGVDEFMTPLVRSLFVAALIAVIQNTDAMIPFPEPPPSLPKYRPTYDMRSSTILYGCNYTGEFDETFAAEWGLVDLDWSNNKPQWITARPMDAGNSLLQTSKRIKAKSGGHTKMWVYRNLVWAPSWFKDVREKLEDPAFAGFFVPFKQSPPWKNQKCSDLGAGKVCSEHFHAQFQSPLPHNTTARPSDKAQAGVCDAMGCDCGSVPCAWYLFDHRNATLRKWIAEKFLLSPSGLMDDAVDGY